MDTVHKGRLGAEANDISRAIWAAKAGGLGQHILNACLAARRKTAQVGSLRHSYAGEERGNDHEGLHTSEVVMLI